jgi:peptide/nickel transport system ATP-binding protein
MVLVTHKVVIAGLSRPKDGVASARLCPAIHRAKRSLDFLMDARVKPAHDGLKLRSAS